MNNDYPPDVSDAQALADSQRWLERAVIGLNLCPFAKAVHARGQIHWAVYPGQDANALLSMLVAEAEALLALDAAVRDTALLILPNTLADFLDFNDFVERAERRLERAGHDGVLQLAFFHPQFQFDGTEPDDIENATNRSPYPTLHLLREDSVSDAVEAFPDTDSIYEKNIETMEKLGADGWAALDVGAGAAR